MVAVMKPPAAKSDAMKIDLSVQRNLDRWAGIPLCLLLSLVDRLRSPRKPDSPPQRILVILLSEMGSLVLAQPLFAKLRKNYPAASISVMLFARNRQLLDLLELVPRENVIAVSDKSLVEMARDSLRAIALFRRQPFDIVIDCELFSRVSSIFAYLSGAAVRVGFHPFTSEGLYRGSFINRPVLYNPYRHLTEQLLTMVDAIDSESRPSGKEGVDRSYATAPMVKLPEEEQERVGSDLFTSFPAIRGKRLVLINPSGGSLPIRAWPLASYMNVAAELLKLGYAVGVIGLSEDKAFGKAVVEHCQHPNCVDLTDYTLSVRHLIGVFHYADLLISNDGGPGQFAALTPIQAIIIFGPETPILYGVCSQRYHLFYTNWPCSPCLTAFNHRNSPCDGNNLCIKSITPEQVLAKALEMLQKEKPEPGGQDHSIQVLEP
jgi:ADP-heptose:LPS heptosyltransferase